MIQLIQKHKGVGDTVKFIADSTGVSGIVNKISEITGLPCGCKERQEEWNRPDMYLNKLLYGKRKDG